MIYRSSKTIIQAERRYRDNLLRFIDLNENYNIIKKTKHGVVNVQSIIKILTSTVKCLEEL